MQIFSRKHTRRVDVTVSYVICIRFRSCVLSQGTCVRKVDDPVSRSLTDVQLFLLNIFPKIMSDPVSTHDSPQFLQVLCLLLTIKNCVEVFPWLDAA